MNALTLRYLNLSKNANRKISNAEKNLCIVVEDIFSAGLNAST